MLLVHTNEIRVSQGQWKIGQWLNRCWLLEAIKLVFECATQKKKWHQAIDPEDLSLRRNHSITLRWIVHLQRFWAFCHKMRLRSVNCTNFSFLYFLTLLIIIGNKVSDIITDELILSPSQIVCVWLYMRICIYVYVCLRLCKSDLNVLVT